MVNRLTNFGPLRVITTNKTGAAQTFYFPLLTSSHGERKSSRKAAQGILLRELLKKSSSLSNCNYKINRIIKVYLRYFPTLSIQNLEKLEISID